LTALQAQVNRLQAALEQRVVQLGGQPPRTGRPPVSGGTISLGAQGLDHFRAAFEWVFGMSGAPLPPPELRRTEHLYRLLTGDAEWHGVFRPEVAFASANSTTLAGLAADAMNKVIVELYERLAHYRWFEQIVAVQPTDGTLQDMQWIQFGGLANLPQVAEGAAYTELSVDDTKESAGFVKYGGYVGITDKMLRNSEIARLQAIPRALTIAALQTRSAAIASIFTQNGGVGPTLAQDSKALFHADHGNLATTAYSWSAWKAARLECAKQAELGSAKRQMLFPRYLLVPADLYDQALIDFGYGAGPAPGTPNNDVNPLPSSDPATRPIPIAVPDPPTPPIGPTSPTRSSLHHLHGPTPTTRRRAILLELFVALSETAGLMFTNDTLPIKVRDTYAYGVATYRGVGKRNVA
jgi:hypothetical protein